MQATPSPSFAFLAHHDARLVALATQAEQSFSTDPMTALVKLRQFGELGRCNEFERFTATTHDAFAALDRSTPPKAYRGELLPQTSA